MTPSPPAAPLLSGRRATVITSSDGVAHGTRDDDSGQALADLLADAGADVADRVVVPDQVARIQEAIRTAATAGPGVVVVTGGTGLGPRDVTPEAIAGVADRTIPGFGEAMRAAGRRVTPLADLSRSVGAAVGTCVVVAVPGSPRGAVESLEAVLALVPHVLDLLAGTTEHHGGEHAAARAGVAAHDHADAASHDPGHGEAGHVHDDACAQAHGDGDDPVAAGTLMAVFASPLAAILLAWARELGWEPVLVDPARPPTQGDDGTGLRIVADTSTADATTDIVVTDHHRDELVDMLDVALDTPARFIGLMGSTRHQGPHVDPLRERGRDDDDLARIVRPIGIDIGSRTPGEIAVSTLADLIARRRGRSA